MDDQGLNRGMFAMGEQLNLGIPDDESGTETEERCDNESIQVPLQREDMYLNVQTEINNVTINGYRSPTQNEMLDYVTNSVQSSKNLMIECPSELERRQAILSGILLHWQAARKRFEPPRKIYYAICYPREMDSVVSTLLQLQWTGHLNGLKMSVLAHGREFYFDENKLVNENWENVQNSFYRLTKTGGTGQNFGEADLIFCLQECVLSPTLQKNYRVALTNSILVFDDGHEIEDTCCKQATISVTRRELNTASNILSKFVKNGPPGHPQPEVECLQQVAQVCSKLSSWMLAEWLDLDSLSSNNKEIFKGLSNEINPGDEEGVVQKYLKNLHKMHGLIPDQDAEVLKKLRVLLKTILLFQQNHSHDFDLKLRAHGIQDWEDYPVLEVICASPSVIFEPVERVASSVIVASKCLSPITPLLTELRIDFYDVDKVQNHEMEYFFSYCSKGPNDVELTMEFIPRTDPSVIKEAGDALIEICSRVPNGVVALFHSEYYMSQVLESWREARTGIMRRLGNIKHVIVEPVTVEGEDEVSNEDTDRLLGEYKNKCINHLGSRTGAVLLAHHRGPIYKKGELKDDEIRAVVHISIPYGSWFKPKYVAKRNFFHEEFGPESVSKNLDWYNAEAFRVMNKSFCDAVQHENDWGVVIVLDRRVFKKKGELKEKLPPWVNKSFRCYNFSYVMDRLNDFVGSRLTEGQRD